MASPDYAAAGRWMQDHGFNPASWNNLVVAAAALERGIDVFGKPDRKSIFLRQGGKEHRWSAGTSSLNSRLASRCISQKDVVSRLLRNAGVPAPENCVFDVREPERAWAWAQWIAPVVVKPFDGRRGRDVHMGIEDAGTLTRVFQDLAERYQTVLVENQVSGKDHRVLVVDGEVIAITCRRPPNVQGDGVASISELVDRKNADRGVAHKKIKLDGIALDFLASQGLTVDSVPAPGEEVQIRGSANLATGGDATDVTDEMRGPVQELMARSVDALPGLRCAGFDVVVPQGGGDEVMNIIEINASPAIQGHHFPWAGTPRDAAGAVLDAMFPETRA